jgi:RNA polymerase sigma-70 factor (ECF subfamily)
VSCEVGAFPQGYGTESGTVLSKLVVDSLTSPSSVILRDERKQQVLQGLAEVDEIDREVLILRHFELLSNDVTAMILGLSRTAASNRYIRSLQRLETVLSEIMDRT